MKIVCTVSGLDFTLEVNEAQFSLFEDQEIAQDIERQLNDLVQTMAYSLAGGLLSGPLVVLMFHNLNQALQTVNEIQVDLVKKVLTGTSVEQLLLTMLSSHRMMDSMMRAMEDISKSATDPAITGQGDFGLRVSSDGRDTVEQ